MKQYVYLFLLVCCSTPLFSQIQRGDRLIMMNGAGGVVAPYASELGSLTFRDFGNFTDDQVALNLRVRYGYALRDRLVVGTGVGVGLTYQDGLSTGFGLSPFARYYFLNRSTLGVFAEAGTGISSYRYGDSEREFSAFGQLDLSAGIQVPLAPGLLLTPAVGYSVWEGSNTVSVGVGLELLLQPDEDDAEVVGSFGKGTLTLGAQSAHLNFQESIFSGGFTAGGQYFLTDRVAVGAQLGLSVLRVELPDSDPDLGNSQRAYSLGVGGSLRHYLGSPQRLRWFVDGGGGVTYSRHTVQLSDGSTAGNGLISHTNQSINPYIAAGGGAQYFLRDNVALEVGPQLRYNLGDNSSQGRWLPGIHFGFRVGL